MAVTAALIIVGHLVIRRTRMGKAMRATFQNKEASALVGIRIDRVYMYTFTFGAALAAAAGAVLGGFIPVEPTMGGVVTLKAFVVVILGGMGSFVGAIVGGLLLGLAEALGAGYMSSGWKDAIADLEKVIELDKGGSGRPWFLLSMAHWQLGDKPQARSWYDKAVRWMEKNQPKNEELIRFRAEAAALLGVDETKH